MEKHVFRLFVAGHSARSDRAIANLRAMCETYLTGRYHLDIVDVSADPAAAEAEKIVATPTLVKERPRPVRRIIGDLSDQQEALRDLDVPPEVPDS